MSLDDEVRKIVRETVQEILGNVSVVAPDLITVEEAAKICDCHTSVIYSLIQEISTTNFPAVKFGTRTIKIDRRRLHRWIEQGGLFAVTDNE